VLAAAVGHDRKEIHKSRLFSQQRKNLVTELAVELVPIIRFERLDRLGDFLKSCEGGEAMNLEELDGFFAALIAGPETMMPSEYYAEVFGGEMSDTCEFDSLGEANEILRRRAASSCPPFLAEKRRGRALAAQIIPKYS
jgi:hypothetical protein